MAVAGGSSLLSGCASGGGGEDTVSGGGADKTADNPFGVTASDPLSVVIFEGGYGDDYAKFHEGLYTDQQVLMALAVKHGGPEVVYAIDSLAPDAWKNESITMAAEALLEIKNMGYMLEGTEGLDHIQSQTRWNEHKAAFIPCGSWLENEQKEVAPSGFETTVATTPLLSGAVLPFDCTRVEAAEAFVVPAKAANQAGGMEYLRKMLSKDGAAEFTKLTAAPTVVDGAADGQDLTPGAASAIALI